VKPYAIGVDVGGTKIAAGLVRKDGSVVQRHWSCAHAGQEPERVIEAIEAACGAVLTAANLAAGDVEAIGLGFAGNTNGAAGVVLVSSNLPAWRNVPLRDIVSARLGMSVILDNDCNLAAVGEHRYGAGRGARNMCYVTVSTGYGMGIIIDNRLYAGHTGTAGELGHVVVEPGGPLCTCGKRGCLMVYGSGIGLSRMAYEKIRAGAATLLAELAPVDGRRIPGEVIAEAARRGDAVACEILRLAATYCGIGLSMAVQIINPQVIVVGGGLTHVGSMLEEPMLAAMREHIQPELRESVCVRPWQLGEDLGIVGGAAMVFADAELRQAQFDSHAGRFIIERAEHAASKLDAIPAPEPLSPSERARLEQVTGVVFDVQRYSLHDGPGLRTDVFMKGCPLRCEWCANPESQRPQRELALFAGQCMACGQFVETCPDGWKKPHDERWNPELTREYSIRAALCPTGAMRWIGESHRAGEIMQQVMRDAPFYQEGGGLTLTGGEPTMQPQMAEALLRLARAECLSTALETCGQAHWAVLQALLPYVDHVLFDLKHVDARLHRRYTGVDNDVILANLRRLAALNAPLTIRVPLVPGFNATPEDVGAIAGFVRGLGGSPPRVDLLPYHTLGKAKYAALGRAYAWEAEPRLKPAEVEALAGVVRSHGLYVSVGG